MDFRERQKIKISLPFWTDDRVFIKTRNVITRVAYCSSDGRVNVDGFGFDFHWPELELISRRVPRNAIP